MGTSQAGKLQENTQGEPNLAHQSPSGHDPVMAQSPLRGSLSRVSACLAFGTLPQDGAKPVGYSDTPKLPDSPWRVHDVARPVPKVLQAQEAGKPPADAVVLFDGTSLEGFSGNGGKANWKVENGYAEANKSGDIATKEAFGDCQLHLEFCTPSPPKGESQGRGNSGVFLMSRYEVQVLDSYENKTYADGQCGAIYGQTPPLVNVARKPGEWQSYDILFTAPRFDGEKLTSPGFVTVLHNGIVVQNHTAILGSTAHRSLPKYGPHEQAPLRLQDHGDPVRYRNIWIRRL